MLWLYVQGDYHKTPSEVSEKREAALKELRETRDNDMVRKAEEIE